MTIIQRARTVTGRVANLIEAMQRGSLRSDFRDAIGERTGAGAQLSAGNESQGQPKVAYYGGTLFPAYC